MFFRWENIIKIKKINKIFESGTLVVELNDISAEITVSLNILTTKTVKAPNIEDKDEYLNIKDIIIHVNTNKKHNWVDKPVIIPK